MRPRAKDLAVILGAALIILALYVPVMLRGRTLVDDPALLDVSFNYWPNIEWMARSWQSGEFPLWNPHTHCGMPHLAYTHSGGLYPVRVLLYTLLPFFTAASLSIIIHSLLAAVLFFLVLRRLQIQPLLAGAAGLLYVLSGFFFGNLYILDLLGSTCAFFAMWLCLPQLLSRPRFSPLVGAGLAVAWCGIVGDVELMTYGLAALGLLLLLQTGVNPRGWARLLALYGLPVTIGFLLIAPLAFAVMETVHFSIRGPFMPFPLEMPAMGGAWQAMLATWLFPFAYFREAAGSSAFNSGLSSLYQGFLVPWLLPWALASGWRRKDSRPLAVTWIALLGFLFARSAPLTSGIFSLVPIIGSLKTTTKTLFLIDALGLAMVFQTLSRSYGAPREERPTILGLLLVGAGLAMTATAPWCTGGPERYALGILAAAAGVGALVRRRGGPLLSARAAVLAAAGLLVIEAVTLAYRCVPRTDPHRFDLAPGPAALARTLPPETRFAVFEQLLADRPSPSTPPPIFGSFELASGAGNPVGPSRVLPARTFLFLSRIYHLLIVTGPGGAKYYNGWSMTNSGTIDRGRMHLFNLAGIRLILGRDTPIPYASPYSLMRPRALEWSFTGSDIAWNVDDQSALMTGPAALRATVSALPGDRLQAEAAAPADSWLLARAQPEGTSRGKILFARFLRAHQAAALTATLPPGVSHALTIAATPPADHPARVELTRLDLVNEARPFQRLAQWGPIEAFANREALPRAFIAHQPVVIGGLQERLEVMDDPARFSPSRQVLLEQTSPEVRVAAGLAPPPDALARSEQVRITAYGPHRVEMDAALIKPGFLVFTDSYFPGWTATVTSRGVSAPARILPADLAFRAVFLPEGLHHVTWRYQPVPFRLGLWTLIASAAAMTAAGARFGALRFARRAPSGPARAG